MIKSPTEKLIAEKDGAIGWMTFNNPARRNALSIDMWEGIPVVLDQFEQDDDIRVIVLRGAGRGQGLHLGRRHFRVREAPRHAARRRRL